MDLSNVLCLCHHWRLPQLLALDIYSPYAFHCVIYGFRIFNVLKHNVEISQNVCCLWFGVSALAIPTIVVESHSMILKALPTVFVIPHNFGVSSNYFVIKITLW